MNIDNFKKFVIDNYKIFIPIALLVVVFLAFIIYYFVSKTFVFSKVETRSYYQYFGEEKIVYDLEVTKNRKNVITDLNPVDRHIQYDSTPVYDSNLDIVIFPSDMSVVMPDMNCSQYLTKANSYIKYENKRYFLVTDNFNNYLGHYFFYDGDNLYLFLEDITLVVGNEKIELGAFSYFKTIDDRIEYYDKVNDVYKSIKSVNYDAYILYGDYKIYLQQDYIDYYDEEVLLISDLSYLSTIDEMRRITNE